MARLATGYGLFVCIVLGCGESTQPQAEAHEGGAANTKGSSGEAGEDNEDRGGSSATGGAGEAPGEATAYFEPGARLKPHVLSSDNGIEVIEGSLNGGWYDSELDFDCAFFPDETGVERCFPRALRPGPMHFADADCTRPILAGTAGSCSPLPRYVVAQRGCTFRGFRVNDELPPSSPLFFSDDGTSCVPIESTSELEPAYHLEAVPADTFVGMRRHARPRASGLDAYVREGDDGSWQIIGYFDPAREAACFDSPFVSEPAPKCVPTTAGVMDLFVEATCETPVGDPSLRACEIEQPTAMTTVRTRAGVCQTAYDVELYEIDGRLEAKPHQVDDSGTCVESPEPSREFYVRGAAIDQSMLPTLETFELGTGALRALFSGFGGIPYLPVGTTIPLRDEAGDPCTPFRFPDGSLRCVSILLPSAFPSDFVYEDASCSDAPLVAYNAIASCPVDSIPRGVVIPELSADCPDHSSLSEVRAVTGKSEASMLYARDASGACAAAGAPPPTRSYLRLGGALEATDFAELRRFVRE